MNSSFSTVFCLLFVAFAAPKSWADTLWTGPNITFTQSATNMVDELIPGAVSFTRDYNQWLFNPDAGDTGPGPDTPTDTLWAFGLIENYLGLDYQTFASYRDNDLSALLIGNPMVVYLINENAYLSLTFSAWPQHGGFFAYTRSTPPLVTITNPADGAVFAAPATVQIGATTAFASGPATNVAFYTNGVLLKAVQSAPFNVTAAKLPAGSYALTAVASAPGISATSAVVNITVVSPVVVTLTSPGAVNGQFVFNYTANTGLSYVVEVSTNLVNWLSVATNMPANSPAQFSASLAPNGAQFYRVARLPNP